MIEWEFINSLSINLEIYILLDWISLLFISLIILISSMIIVYRNDYINKDLNINRFIWLVILFILSIVLIIVRPNLISIMFGWDGLGLVSYCLVIYYHNYSSYNSGIVTVLSNRLGDVSILIAIGLIIRVGSWNIWIVNRSLVIFMIVLASITKRAQLPFSYWLPMAIAAPTPVSALVHSSTLVTAGVYLIIRFNKILLMRWAGELFKIAVLTIFISGLIANFEFDLKKIIALSTLRQLGLMIIILRLGMGILSFFHLLTHAIFKSILFICAGIIIHSINNNQDIRVYGGLNEYLPFTIIRFYISRLSLCGFPFLSGFYSKDLIIELIYLNKISYISLFLIIFSLGFTISYSFRLFYYLFFYEIKFMRANNIKESFKINLSIIFLIFLSILGGRNLWWLFIRDLRIIYLRIFWKLMTLIVSFFILVFIKLIFIIKFEFNIFYWLKFLLGNILNLNNFMIIIHKIPIKGGYIFYLNDKTWLEISSRLIYIIVATKLFNFKFNMFKMNIFIFFMIRIMIIFVLLIYLNSLN